MKKIKTFLQAFPEHIQGYCIGHINGVTNNINADFPYASIIYDKMCEVLPINSRYITHFVESEFKEDPNLPTYTPECSSSLKIPRGTLSYYLIIYYEDKDDIGEHNAPVHFSL